MQTNYPNNEPNYEQLIQKLPKACFECEIINENNSELFIIDNSVVIPDNIIKIENYAFRETTE